MAVLSTYTPATDDLCLYGAGNVGIPTGWNPTSRLAAYVGQLGGLKVPERRFDTESATYPEPGGTSLAQKPNYWNANRPPIAFVASRVALGCQHQYEGGNFNRNRNPATSGIWSAQTYAFADAAFSLTTLDRLDFLRPWTRDESGVQVTPSDVGVFEYNGATPFAGGTFPVLIPETIPFGTAGFGLDGNGKLFEFTTRRTNATTATDPVFAFDAPNVLEFFDKDSGALFFVPVAGVLHLVAHQFSASVGSPGTGGAGYARANLPSSYIDGLGSGKQWTPIGYPSSAANVASQTDALDVLSRVQAIAATLGA